MAKKFGEGVSDAQVKLARRMQAAGCDSYSQIIKAFQRYDNVQIEKWKEQLKAYDAQNGHVWANG
jgi:hypothetical protein